MSRPRCLLPQVLVDLSCGSGLFARRFAKSGRFAGVVATDFSENMLRQAKQNFDADTSISPRCCPLSERSAARRIRILWQQNLSFCRACVIGPSSCLPGKKARVPASLGKQ